MSLVSSIRRSPSDSGYSYQERRSNYVLEEFRSMTVNRLVVGVDYGTTYSGVSYVTTSPADSSIDDINVLQTWPGSVGTENGVWKTPSCIAYGSENAKVLSDKWGFEVTPSMKSYSWTKLLLDQSAAPTDFDDPSLQIAFGRGLMKLPAHRNASGVVEDYLRQLYNHATAHFKRQITEETFDRTPMDCWITMPAIWSDKAQQATHDAALKAGWGSRSNDRIFMIPEPEAAAVATLTTCTGPKALDPLKAGEIILVCDCGGGTVDITTYEVKSSSPQLEFKEVCVGTGGKCGSTYIDRNFHALMAKRFGAAFKDLEPIKIGPRSRLMRSFEAIKCGFGETETMEDREIEPFLMDVEASEYYDPDSSTVFLTHTDLKGLFSPVIQDVITLIEEQAAEAKDVAGSNISRIILVGGFGASPELYRGIDAWCKKNGNIRLMCPPHPQAAIVRGAALRGLSGMSPTSRKCRKFYGHSCGMSFRPGQDPESKAYYDPWDNTKRCSQRMSWLISKGEEISKTTRNIDDLEWTRYDEDRGTNKLSLYACGMEEAPEYCDSAGVEWLGDIVLDLSFVDWETAEQRATLRGVIYKIVVEVSVMFGEDEGLLKFKVLRDGTVAGTADIEYDRF